MPAEGKPTPKQVSKRFLCCLTGVDVPGDSLSDCSEELLRSLLATGDYTYEKGKGYMCLQAVLQILAHYKKI